MKTPRRTLSNDGFTLLELLVVIAIIAVLAAVGFGAGKAAMESAKKVSALAGATSITRAVNSFYSEYSALPDPTGNSTTDTGPAGLDLNSADGIKLLEILAATGSNAIVTDQNPRKIRFFSYKEAKNGMDGIKYGTGTSPSIEGMFDPWGQPYYVVLDYDYDERIKVHPKNNPEVTLNGRNVAVYSLGVREMGDAGPGKLVKTW